MVVTRTKLAAASGIAALLIGVVVVGHGPDTLPEPSTLIDTGGTALAAWLAKLPTDWESGYGATTPLGLDNQTSPNNTKDVRKPSGSITADYQDWEKDHAALAEEELERRLAADEAATTRMDLAHSYSEWEQAHATLALDYLQERLEATAIAKQDVTAAQARLAAAVGTQEVNQAQLDLAAAEARLQDHDRLVEHAKTQALLEMQQAHHSERLALTKRADELASTQASAMAMQELSAKTLVAATDLIVRGAPTNTAEKIGELKRGDQVTVNAQGHGFYRLQGGGFASQAYLVAPGTAGVTEPYTPNQTSPSRYAWETHVANIDEQQAVDACAGGVTYSPTYSEKLGKAYYPIHVQCHGRPILDLEPGDLVNIESVGVFKVETSRDVKRGDKLSSIVDLPGDALLQTCYPDSRDMRVVALSKVSD